MKNLNKISLKSDSLEVRLEKLDRSLSNMTDFKEKAKELIQLMAKNRLLIVFAEKWQHNEWHYSEIDSPDDYDNISINYLKKDDNNKIIGINISYWNKEYDYDDVSIERMNFTIPSTYFDESNQKDILNFIKEDIKLKKDAAAIRREEIEKQYKEMRKVQEEERKAQAEINEKKEFLRLQKKFWKKS